MWNAHEFLSPEHPYSEVVKGHENISIPCWSVGRLIEIYLICACNALQLVELTDDDIPLIDEMVNKIEEDTARYLDFSKLEE